MAAGTTPCARRARVAVAAALAAGLGVVVHGLCWFSSPGHRRPRPRLVDRPLGGSARARTWIDRRRRGLRPGRPPRDGLAVLPARVEAYRRLQQRWDAADAAERSPPGRRGGLWTSRASCAATCSPCRTPRVRLPSCSPSTASLNERRASPPSPTSSPRRAPPARCWPSGEQRSGVQRRPARRPGAGRRRIPRPIIRQLAGTGIADPRRVTVAGFSNGAGMAMRLATGHPGPVAAVVSVDGELLAGAGSPRPTAPVRIYLVHGRPT